VIEKRYFLLTFMPVRKGLHASMRPEEQALVERHFHYLNALQEEGILHFAGRSEDGQFGIAIVETPNRERAQAIIDDNPAVVGGVFVGDVKAYHLPLGSTPSRR
jgi:uncharacterized protein